MRIFWKKCKKNCLSIGGSTLEPPLVSDGWGLAPRLPRCYSPSSITTLSSSFLALNVVYYTSRSHFASSKFLHLFFTSNSVVFVDWGLKNVSCPRVQGTLATPLLIRCSMLNLHTKKKKKNS